MKPQTSSDEHPMNMELHEEHVQRIAASLGLTVKLAFKGDRCPPWQKSAPMSGWDFINTRTCRGCKGVHGDLCRVTLRFEPAPCPACAGQPHPHNCTPNRVRTRHSLSFDFWGSYHDKTTGARPGYYDVLACVAADAGNSVDPDEINRECGPMAPSQAIAIAKHSARLKGFFTEGELTALQEIS